MSDKKLTVLGVIAVAAALLAVVQSRLARPAAPADFSSSPLVAGLNVEAVAGLTVTADGGSRTVTLTRQDGQFVVADKDRYPADVSKINTLINDCLDIRVSEKITDNPANHADLKVTEATAAYVITFLGADETPIVSVVLSPADPDSGIAHGRLGDRDAVYAVRTPVRFSATAMEFIDSQLLAVDQSRISRVAVKTPAGDYVLTGADGGVKLEAMPAGKQLKDSEAQSVFGALSRLRFEDVRSTASAPADLAFDYQYTCKLKDLTVYKLSLARQDETVYAKVSATYLDATPVEKTVGEVESDEALKQKEDKLLAIDAVKDFTARHRGWVYQIPAYQAGNLTKPLDELIEDMPEPETPEDADDVVQPAADAETTPQP